MFYQQALICLYSVLDLFICAILGTHPSVNFSLWLPRSLEKQGTELPIVFYTLVDIWLRFSHTRKQFACFFHPVHWYRSVYINHQPSSALQKNILYHSAKRTKLIQIRKPEKIFLLKVTHLLFCFEDTT